MRPALERIGARYRLASLSNGNADLERIGLAHHVSLTLNARQIGAAKPDPLCFERLASGLRLAPRNILHVGDDPELDVEAARRAGLRTAWMNRGASDWPSKLAPADFEVADCFELAGGLD